MDYPFGRMVLGFLGLVSIAIIVVGIIMAATGSGVGASVTRGYGIGAAAPAGLIGAVPGLIVTIGGIILLAWVEYTGATFDSATHSKQLVKIAEEQLRVSRQALKIGALATPGYSEMNSEQRERLIGNNGSSRKGFLGLFARKDEGTEVPIAPYDEQLGQKPAVAASPRIQATEDSGRLNGGNTHTTRVEPRLRATQPSSSETDT